MLLLELKMSVPSLPPYTPPQDCYSQYGDTTCFDDQQLPLNQVQQVGPYDINFQDQNKLVTHVTATNGHRIQITSDVADAKNPTVKVEDLTDGKSAEFGLGPDAEAGQVIQRSGNLDARIEPYGGDGETVSGDYHLSVVWGDRDQWNSSELKIGSSSLFSNHPDDGSRDIEVAFSPTKSTDPDDLKIVAGGINFKPQQLQVTHEHYDEASSKTTYTDYFHNDPNKADANAGSQQKKDSDEGFQVHDLWDWIPGL